MREKTGEEMFGAAVPGEAVESTFGRAADRREAEAAERSAQYCAGCGRLWRHDLGSGHGERTQRYDGAWWHRSCRAKVAGVAR
jgi:hypothetical protein